MSCTVLETGELSSETAMHLELTQRATSCAGSNVHRDKEVSD